MVVSFTQISLICLRDCVGTLEVFSLFDKDEDGEVKVTDIGPMLRSIGFNPSEEQIERLQDEQDTENGSTRYLLFVLTSHRLFL